MFRSFGQILELGKDKKEKEFKRMKIMRELANVEEIELLLKSNITKMTRILAESFASDLGGHPAKDRESIFLAGIVYENEKLLKDMESSKEFFRKYERSQEEI